jgi:hypothetical protein
MTNSPVTTNTNGNTVCISCGSIYNTKTSKCFECGLYYTVTVEYADIFGRESIHHYHIITPCQFNRDFDIGKIE